MSARVVPDLLAAGYADGWPPMTPVGAFLEAIRQGNTATTAALTSQLDPADVARWAIQGSALLSKHRGGNVPKPRRPFSDFVLALARAEAEAEAAMIEVVRDTALGDTKDSWRAAAWLLDHQAKAAPPLAEEPDDEDELARYATPVSGPDSDTTE